MYMYTIITHSLYSAYNYSTLITMYNNSNYMVRLNEGDKVVQRKDGWIMLGKSESLFVVEREYVIDCECEQ